jgi:hypothetical protein
VSKRNQALTPERLDRLPALLPTLTPFLPSESSLLSASAAAVAAAASPNTARWEAALEEVLPPARLQAWSNGFDSTVNADRFGLLLDAAGLLLRPDRSLLRRLMVSLGGGSGGDDAPAATATTGAAAPQPAAAAADATEPSDHHGQPGPDEGPIPGPWSTRDLTAAVALLDATLAPSTLGPLAALGDEALTGRRLEAVAAALDRALPPLGDAAAGGGRQSVPPFVMRALRAAARSGLAARWVKAAAAAVAEPRGRAAALRLLDAATAAPSALGERLEALPPAVELLWAFHVGMLLG